MDKPSLIEVARGDAPADVLFVGGRIVDVFTGEILEEDVAVSGRFVAGLGPGYSAAEVVELEGRYLLPGFIDAHVHIESSLATPVEFARAVVPHGTTTAVADPHEIANVHGLEGIRYMLEASEGIPLTVFVMASSCVPATAMGTAGADLSAEDLVPLLDHPRVIGLAEVMNFPGVIYEHPAVGEKLRAFSGHPIDGHAPGVWGQALNAYVAGGPSSDHECISVEEALERIRRGMTVFFREATNARNLDTLLPALTPRNLRRVALCTDDRQPPDLLDEGGIDAMVRKVIKSGIPPVEAIRMATLNPADHFRMLDRGGIAPGRRADLLVAEDLEALIITEAYTGGRLAAREGRPLPWKIPPSPAPPPPSMRVAWESVDFRIPSEGRKARVIEVIPNQLVTGVREVDPMVANGQVVSDPDRDLLKIAVMERHWSSGRVGLGLVYGMGLKEGAIAGTVAHDHHNLIALGVDDESILAAAKGVGDLGGGLAVALGGRVVAALPLPVGGLMSLEPIESVREGLDQVLEVARSLGTPLHDPFMAMSFLSLEVIPSLKITDQGLVDVDAFEKVGFWV